MPDRHFPYIIAGGGVAGANAVQGIRELDKDNPILLIGAEQHLPYDRPPLTKDLWTGKKTVDQIYVHDRTFYEDNGVRTELGTRVVALNAVDKTVTDHQGRVFKFDRLLLATGATPRTLTVEGGNLAQIRYYRYLDDYARVSAVARRGRSCVVIGGGFIGAEIAPSLALNGVSVTMVFPEEYLCQRVLPRSLGMRLTDLFRERGIAVLTGDSPVGFAQEGEQILTVTRNGAKVLAGAVVAGIGVLPNTEPAGSAGLHPGDGIVVNSMLQSGHPDIYAAGDNARFPYKALGTSTRIEHWDNALNQGLFAGRNMAGARQEYTYLPYFYSDMFEFGYEAVGEIDSRLETYADWQLENDTGTVYYLDKGKVRGVLLCNLRGRLDQARELIRLGEKMTPVGVRGTVS